MRTTRKDLEGVLKMVSVRLADEGHAADLYLERDSTGWELFEDTHPGARSRSWRLPAGSMEVYLRGMAEGLWMVAAA